LKSWALPLKPDIKAVHFASRDPRVPWYRKALAIAFASYALSPIDLTLTSFRCWAMLMTLIIFPLGIALVVRLTPPEVIEEYRIRAATSQSTQQASAERALLFWSGS